MIFIESYTARPYQSRPRPSHISERPLHQGNNPYGDIGCIEALRLSGIHFIPAVQNPKDFKSREKMVNLLLNI